MSEYDELEEQEIDPELVEKMNKLVERLKERAKENNKSYWLRDQRG